METPNFGVYKLHEKWIFKFGKVDLPTREGSRREFPKIDTYQQLKMHTSYNGKLSVYMTLPKKGSGHTQIKPGVDINAQMCSLWTWLKE
jgi:hypothetical protein